jgi:TatD DNase family protein
MIQRALNKGISRFLFRNRLFLHSGNVEGIIQNMFSDDGTASYPCKRNYLEELQHVEEEAAKILRHWRRIDLYWDKTYLLEQQIAFRKQIQLKAIQATYCDSL